MPPQPCVQMGMLRLKCVNLRTLARTLRLRSQPGHRLFVILSVSVESGKTVAFCAFAFVSNIPGFEFVSIVNVVVPLVDLMKNLMIRHAYFRWHTQVRSHSICLRIRLKSEIQKQLDHYHVTSYRGIEARGLMVFVDPGQQPFRCTSLPAAPIRVGYNLRT